MNKMFLIYKISNSENQLVYIGFTSRHDLQKRFYEHSKSNFVIGQEIRRIGMEKFKIEAVFCGSERGDTLNYWEPYFIKAYNSMSPNGYNHSYGGEGSYSEEISAKISTASKRKWEIDREEMVKKCVKYGPDNSSYGRPVSESTREKMRKALLGRDTLSPQSRAKANDAIRRVSLGNRGKKRSPEDVKKSRDAMLTSVDRKYGFIIEGVRYKSLRDASKKLGIAINTVRKILNGDIEYLGPNQDRYIEVYGKVYSSKDDFRKRHNLTRRMSEEFLRDYQSGMNPRIADYYYITSFEVDSVKYNSQEEFRTANNYARPYAEKLLRSLGIKVGRRKSSPPT